MKLDTMKLAKDVGIGWAEGMPIDEMLMDLRTILEAFDAEPNHTAFAHLQLEMTRIERFCEDMLPEDE
jgi:hypothetical protein